MINTINKLIGQFKIDDIPQRLIMLYLEWLFNQPNEVKNKTCEKILRHCLKNEKSNTYLYSYVDIIEKILTHYEYSKNPKMVKIVLEFWPSNLTNGFKTELCYEHLTAFKCNEIFTYSLDPKTFKDTHYQLWKFFDCISGLILKKNIPEFNPPLISKDPEEIKENKEYWYFYCLIHLIKSPQKGIEYFSYLLKEIGNPHNELLAYIYKRIAITGSQQAIDLIFDSFEKMSWLGIHEFYREAIHAIIMSMDQMDYYKLEHVIELIEKINLDCFINEYIYALYCCYKKELIYKSDIKNKLLKLLIIDHADYNLLSSSIRYLHILFNELSDSDKEDLYLAGIDTKTTDQIKVNLDIFFSLY